MEQTLLLLQQYGYYILFPFAVFEGPIIGVIAGFLAAAGKMNVLGVFLVLIAGDMVGDVMYYGLGRWGGRTIVVRYGRYIGITPAKMQAAERYQDSKSFTALLLFGKTQPTGSIILVAAGITKMPFLDFCIVNLIGTIPKVALLEAAGYYFGDSLTRMNTYLDRTALVSFCIGTVCIVGYLLVRRYMRRASERGGV